MKGCLLLHGYTGSPCEMEPLANILEQKGILTYCPTLHGHKDPERDLHQSTYLDWIQSASEAYIQLSRQCNDIAVIGFSMGGLLAFHLVQKYKAKCLVSMGTPIYCFDVKNIAKDMLEAFKVKNYQRVLEYTGAFRLPLKANWHFRKVLLSSRPLVKNIDVPLLIIQGKKDPVVKPHSAQYIYRCARSPLKEIRYYEHTDHRFHLSRETQNIYNDITSFVLTHL